MKHYLETIYSTEERPITQYPNQLAEYLMKRFGMHSGERILDNGCGRGDFLYAFQQCGMEAYGTDIAESTERVISGGVNLETDKLPYPDNYFNVVFTKSVIEHIHKPDNFLKESYRVLKPGGRVIVMVPDWHSCIYIYYDDCTHVQPYTQTGLYDTLRIFGFSDVASEKFYQLPCVWKHSYIKIICRLLQMAGPVKKVYKNKFYRFSRELILLGTGVKR